MIRVAALAVAHRAANAVGPVAFELGETTMRVEFAGVRPHLRGFALGGESQHVTLEVPYSAVRGVVREGRLLLLAFDPRVLFPYNRFALARFRRDGAVGLVRAARIARLFDVLAWLLPCAAGVSVALASFAATSRWPETLAAGLGILVVTRTVARALAERSKLGGFASDRVRDAFQGMVSERLGLGAGPARVVDLGPSDHTLDELVSSVSRPRWFAPALMVAVLGAVGVGGVVRRYGVAPVVKLPVSDAARGVTRNVQPILDAARAALSPKHPDCRCERADSPLWVEAPTRVAFLVTPLRGALESVSLRPDVVYPVSPGPKDRVEFDFSLVNGSSRSIDEVTLVLTFWKREGSDRRGVEERGLSWKRRLAPGDSVKWRVRAKGDAVRLTSYLGADLEAAPYAPADAFAKLDRAAIAAVRLHGAMMLTYLDDPRAEAAARALHGLAPREETLRSALLPAFELWRVCGVADGTACVENRTRTLSKRAVLTDAAGHEASIADLFFPGRGLRVPFEGAVPPVRATVPD